LRRTTAKIAIASYGKAASRSKAQRPAEQIALLVSEALSLVDSERGDQAVNALAVRNTRI
jgi:hypothetical protein